MSSMKAIYVSILVFALFMVAAVTSFIFTVDKDETVIPKFESSAIITVNPSPTPTPKPLTANELFTVVQQWRRDNNLKEYVQIQKICDYAEIRAEESTTDWSHNGALKNSTERTDMCPVNTKCRMGENLAKDWSTAEQTLDAWLNSPTHRANLEANFKYSCIGQYENNFAQIFLDY